MQIAYQSKRVNCYARFSGRVPDILTIPELLASLPFLNGIRHIRYFDFVGCVNTVVMFVSVSSPMLT